MMNTTTETAPRTPYFARRLPAVSLAAAILCLFLLPTFPIAVAQLAPENEAIQSAKRMLDRTEKTFGPEHRETAARLNDLAELYRNTGDFSRAKPLHERALQIKEKVLGPDDSYTGMSLIILALVHQSMGDYAKAEPLFQRVLRIQEKTLGPQHPNTATTLHNLALAYQSMGDYAKAEPLLQRALRIQEKAPGPEHPHTATTLNNLAEFYHSMGDHAKADPVVVDGERLQGGAWHRELLLRMKSPGAHRPALLSSELHDALLEYLRFRHVFRHAYSFDLDWQKMSPLVLNVEETLRQLESALDGFVRRTGEQNE